MGRHSGKLVVGRIIAEVLSDGGGTYGIGHLKRSVALAGALRGRGHAARIIGMSERARALLAGEQIDEGRATVRIFDFPYNINGSLLERARTEGVLTVALDSFSEKGEPSLTISVFEHKTPPPPGKRVAGLEYSIVRPEVTALAPNFGGEGVVVMIGGGDNHAVGPRVAVRLALQESRVTLVQGPNVATPYRCRHSNVELVVDPVDLPRRMSRCRWAVTNGGSSMLEMMCLGKPAHAIPQTEDELMLARIVAESGAILGIGEERLSRPPTAEEERIGTIASRLVDGKGLERICTMIESLV